VTEVQARELALSQPRTSSIQIFFGTQTGLAESIARAAARVLRGRGCGTQVSELDESAIQSLAAADTALIVCSTYGEGDMPDDVMPFWEAINQPDAPRLDSLKYAVCALGDSGYENFCNAGRAIDARLTELGATSLLARVDCDVDYEEPSRRWLAAVLEVLPPDPSATSISPKPAEASLAATAVTESPPPNREALSTPWQPPRHQAILTRACRLSGPQSRNDVWHYELTPEGSAIEYQVGDAIELLPRNDPAEVSLLLDFLGLEGDTEIDGERLSDVLGDRYELSSPSPGLADLASERAVDPVVSASLRTDHSRVQCLRGRNVLDMLVAAKVRLPAKELLPLLRPLQPRSYSIASSPLVAPDVVHLTISTLRYSLDGRDRGGVCSTYLADRMSEGGRIQVRLKPNAGFRLPDDDDTPVIMIGPGTGVAPFRAFLQERAEAGAPGRNWLFFGAQHERDDFLYRDELTEWLENGHLEHLDLAFSRDQPQRIYVQDRMRLRAAELFAWLEAGAYLYICGDATNMAPDVDLALREIVAEQGGLSREGAAAYVLNLRREKRYRRDVY
jgi:sulfite reductase (NADPH) flavoprotein alpha-component